MTRFVINDEQGGYETKVIALKSANDLEKVDWIHQGETIESFIDSDWILQQGVSELFFPEKFTRKQ